MVSDLGCPWCWVGKRRLEAALLRDLRADGDDRVVGPALHVRLARRRNRQRVRDHLDGQRHGHLPHEVDAPLARPVVEESLRDLADRGLEFGRLFRSGEAK